MRFFKLFILLFAFTSSCKNENQSSGSSSSILYDIVDGKILKYKQPIQLIGANAFHVFGAGSTDMNSWKLDIVREFVGNTKEVRLTGSPFQDSNGAFLHSLQSVVDSNRANNKITILCPFQWNGLSATNFTGQMPKQTYWWNDFKLKLQDWAVHFKNQPDVWLEVWNEPYRYDRADGYTEDIWLSDMNELVNVIRSTGNSNVILVPCAEQGQDESVLISKGAAFLNGKKNILFDVHAYEKWLLVSNISFGSRLQQLKQSKIPVFFGETAPLNAGVLMNPKSFLDSIYNNGFSVSAWVWKYDDNDKDALLNIQGQPNDLNNNNWGTTFKAIASQVRRP